jgi:hypothetical protein
MKTMMKTRYILLTISLVALLGGSAVGQRVALKENFLYAATLTPNLAAEVGIGDRWTVDFMVGYNPWNLKGSEDNNRKMVHLLLEPEVRYWTCERFNGHFFGLHLLGAWYNVGEIKVPGVFEKEFRHEGTAVGGGVSYGYHVTLGVAWGLEFTVGAGVAYMNYEKFDCPLCGTSIGKFNRTYFGPTRAGISLVYILK